MQTTPSEGVGPPYGPGEAPTTSVTASRPRTMLDIRMFPHIMDMILSHCDTSTLARMRLSRNLYRKITPMLAHTVPGCDGDDCGGLANGGCAYRKWKEREPVEPTGDWRATHFGTVKIVQVLRPEMSAETERCPLYGLPAGIERSDTLVLPVDIRILKDMHWVDDYLQRPRLVWYPTDTHPSAEYLRAPPIRCATEVIINYKYWIGPSSESSNSQSLNDLVSVLLKAPARWSGNITLVAPPDGVYEYIAATLRQPAPMPEDYLLAYPERAPPPLEPPRCLTVEEYIDKIGALAEAIESSTPPEGLGWRTFRVTPMFGEPRSRTVTFKPRWHVKQGGINTPPVPASDSAEAILPAWLPHRTSSFHRPGVPRARSH